MSQPAAIFSFEEFRKWPEIKQRCLMFRVPQVCELTGYKKSKVHALIRTKKLPGKKDGGVLTVRAIDLLAYIEGLPDA